MEKITNLSIFNKNKRRSSAGMFNTSSAGAVTSLILIVICCFLIQQLSTYNVSATDSITLHVSSDSLALPITPTSADGSFAASDNITVNVALAGTGGYTLSIRAANSTDLKSGNNTISSIANAISASDFEGSTFYNNQWGYRPNMLNSTENTNYLPSPSLEGDIIEKTSGTNDEGSYTISLGARVDMDTAPGDYANTFIIAAVANNTCNSNAGGILDAYCMQDMNDEVANSMVVGKQYQLVDNRDNTVYYVAKMKDGRVWMTQNLDLGLETDGDSGNVTALNANNTDINNNTGAAYSDYTTVDGVLTWTPSRATTTVASEWDSAYNSLRSYDYGENYYYTDTAGTSTTYNSKSACQTAHPDGTCAHYHMGNYYNYNAVIASNDASSITSGVMANSICPKGWRLPNMNSQYGDANQSWLAEGITTDIVTSLDHYGTYATNSYINISNNPLYMVRAGYKGTGGVGGIGGGYYYTGQVVNANYGYMYAFNNNYPYPYTRYGVVWLPRYYGLPVRCIARQSNTGGSTVITFNKNSDTAIGTMNNQTITAGSSSALTNNSFTNAGQVFTGWNTESNGTGTHYDNLATYYAAVGTLPVNTTLYAEWTPAHTMIVNAGTDINAKVSKDNGSTWVNAPTEITVGEGTTVILQAIDDTEGTVFSNWTKTTGEGSFTDTAWRNSNTKTTAFVVGTGDVTITANSTTSYTTINAGSTTNMKDINACPDWLPTGTMYQVTDSRDSEVYNVAKLADSKCWMLDNLRLNPTTVATLDSTNTNATDSQLTTYKTRVVERTSGFSSYDKPIVNSTYKNNVVTPSSAVYGSASGKVGVYYNYCAASVGTVCTSGDTGSLDTTVDICPAGWRMPTGGPVNQKTGFGEYQALYSAYNSNATNFRNALATSLSGRFNGSTQYNLGSSGYFWSSTFDGGVYSYLLYVYSSGVLPQDDSDRDNGFSMRCVLAN